MLGPHTHTPAPTACAWRTQTARPVGGQSGEGQRLTSDAPHNVGRHPPSGTPFRHPHSEQHRPARAHAVGPVLGPHARTNRTRDTRVAEPWLPAPEDGRLCEGQPLTPDAPHNGRRHPPRECPSATPTASNAGPQERTLCSWCWVPTPAPTAAGTHGSQNPGRPPQTAPDTRRPSQRWQATPPGDGPPPPPRHAAPTGHAGQGDRVGPTQPHARDHCMWVADPNSPPRGRAARGVGALDHRRPSQRWKAPPRERPHQLHPGHTGCGTPAARFRGRPAGGGTAPDTRRPSQRWQATPPGDGPPPPPRHASPTGHAGEGDSVGPPHPHTRAHSTWVADPNSPHSGRAVGGGGAPDLRRPSQRWKAPPPGMPFRHPHSEQRRLPRAHAVGPVLDPHARTNRTRDTRVAEPRLPAPEDGRPGEEQCLTPDALDNGGRLAPRGTAPHHPRSTQPPQGMQAKGTVLGPHTHMPAPTVCGWRTPTAAPGGGQFREGERLSTDAPHNGKRQPPRERPSATPTASNPARKGARCGAGAGSPRPH